MVTFEGFRNDAMPKIEACLSAATALTSLEACPATLPVQTGIDVRPNRARACSPSPLTTPSGPTPWACAIALKAGCAKAADAAEAIGQGLQAFCVPGSVAEQRKVGLGHGNLGAMLLRDETECFCFLAGHESFAAAEGAIGIARTANKARKEPLRVILNGLGKDAAYIICPHQRLHLCGDRV